MAAESHGISEQKRTSPTIGYGSSRPPSHTPDSGKAPAATLTVPRALPPKHQRQPNLVLPEPRPSNGHGHTVLSGRAKPSQRARGSKARCHDGIPAGIGPTASKQHDTPSESVKLQLRLKLTSNTASRRSKHTRIEAEEVRDLSVKWRFTDYSWGGPKCRRLQPKEHQSPLRASPVKAALNPKRKPGSPPWRSVREVTLSIQERGNPLQTSTATSGNTNSGSCDGPSSGTLPPPPSLSTNGGSSNDTTSCPSDELSSERAHPPARPGATIESSAEGRPLDGRLLEHEIVLRLRCVYSDSPHGPSQDLNDDMEVRLGAALHENQLSQWTTRGSPATASALDCYSAHRALIVEVLLVARFHNGQARPQLNNRQFLAGPCARTMEDLSRERNLGRPMFRNIYGEELNSRPMPTDLERFYAYTESIINLHMPAPSRLPETNNRPSMIFEAELEFLQVGPSGQRLASAIKKLHNDLSNDEMDRTRSIQDLYEIGSASLQVLNTTMAAHNRVNDNHQRRVNNLQNSLHDWSTRLQVPLNDEELLENPSQGIWELIPTLLKSGGYVDESTADMILPMLRLSQATEMLIGSTHSTIQELDAKHSKIHQYTYRAAQGTLWAGAAYTGLILGAIGLAALGGPVLLASWPFYTTIAASNFSFCVAAGGTAAAAVVGKEAGDFAHDNAVVRGLMEQVRIELAGIQIAQRDLRMCLAAAFYQIVCKVQLDELDGAEKQRLLGDFALRAEKWNDPVHVQHYVRTCIERFFSSQASFIKSIADLTNHIRQT